LITRTILGEECRSLSSSPSILCATNDHVLENMFWKTKQSHVYFKSMSYFYAQKR
jgi:hypothetical protein